MNTPILFIIFNRPKTTQRVFEEIRIAKPSKLFIAADGPRNGNLSEKKLCDESRSIVSKVDWPCEVRTRFQNDNLGCKIGVSSAINWFFDNVEEGIILEDDCLPSQSFFTFCEKMLEKYRDNKYIMHINGTNFQFGEIFGAASYYFSRCPHVWGWATWKRAWEKYDLEMYSLDRFILEGKTNVMFSDTSVAKFWNSLFKYIKKKKIDTWDVQWTYSVMNNLGIVITPNSNLIKNIGFGANSTHTSETNSKLQQDISNVNDEYINCPIDVSINKEADIALFKKVYYRSIFVRVKSVLISLYNRVIKFKKDDV